MAKAYTPGLKVSARSLYRARRLLPVHGDVLVKAGAPPLSRARGLFDGCTVSPVGELPSVPAFRGKACRFEHSRPGIAHGERRP